MKKIWIIIVGVFLFLVGCGQEAKPEQTLQSYTTAWNEQKFDVMYDQLSSASQAAISKDDFIKRYEKIYKDMEVSQLTIGAVESKTKNEAQNGKISLPFSVKMNTLAGDISFNSSLPLIKEVHDKKNIWKIEWNPSLIFPSMKEGDKVGVQTYKAKRGEILDRDGDGLAVNGNANQVGIVPGKLGDNGEQTKQALANKLGISVDLINNKLKEKWVQPSLFVPLAFLSDSANITDYVSLPGVATKSVPVRTYPFKEAAAHLTGYIREVSADDLKTLKGYRTGDVVGKSGLEQVYEAKLKGENGGRIYVTDASGKEKETLAEKKQTDGETLTVNIDSRLQQSIYNQMKQDAGTAAAINPKTGEILALVSSPSYDPNGFVRILRDVDWQALNNDPKKPLLNRFTKAYAPGSVFKPITAAIGLQVKTMDPAEALPITGLQWAKDASWGNYYITRVHEINPVNLETAMVYSDNIYFAQSGLKIGKDTFTEEAKKFGLGEKLPLAYPFQDSKLGDIKNDIQLADSSYGQGEVVLTSLQAALSYAPFVNDGNIPYPSLLRGENDSKVWKSNVTTKVNIAVINKALIAVVNNPEGTGKSAKIEGMTLAGKTGTAELKQGKEENGTENGWFIGYNADAPNSIVAMMIEDVKNRGGSSYVASKVKNIFQDSKQ